MRVLVMMPLVLTEVWKRNAAHLICRGWWGCRCSAHHSTLTLPMCLGLMKRQPFAWVPSAVDVTRGFNHYLACSSPLWHQRQRPRKEELVVEAYETGCVSCTGTDCLSIFSRTMNAIWSWRADRFFVTSDFIIENNRVWYWYEVTDRTH